MGVFELLMPLEIRNQQAIEALRSDLETEPTAADVAATLAPQLERLELICKLLTELVVAKGVATKDELSVLMQQIDLSDGTEDGRLSPQERRGAPRCGRCQRFANPRRQRCIYCGEATSSAASPYRGSDGAVQATARVVTCGGCQATVDERASYFTGQGLRCEACYDPEL